MGRARGHGALGAGVVLRGRDGRDGVPVAVPEVEDLAGDLRPAGDAPGAGAVVGAVRGAGAQQVEDRGGHVAREGGAAQLVVHHGDAVEPVGRVRHAVRERGHGPREVAAVAHDPAGAQDIVPGAAGHGEVAGGLGLAVDREGAERLRLVVHLAGAVEHVVGGDVDERDAVLGAGPGEQGRPGRVGPPGRRAALGGLGPVDRRVGSAVDHGAVEVPVVAGVLGGVGEVEGVDVAEVEGARDAPLLGERPHGPPQLPPAAGDEGAPGGHGGDVREHRVVPVGLRERGLGEREGPVDAERGVGEVDERVRPPQLRGPVGVHQVGVGGAVLQRLEGVADAAGHVDGPRGVEGAGEDPPVGGAAGAQVHPGAEDRARRHRYELVPGLGVDAAGDAALGVEGDVVLHHAEIGDPQRHHLGPLPVLLEPAAGVPVHGELHNLEALDAGLGNPELFFEFEVCHDSPPSSYCPCLAYFASVASLAGRHQSSWSRYQAMV